MNPQDLIRRYLLGEASDQEIDALEDLLKREPACRREFLHEARMDARLREVALEEVADTARPHESRIVRLSWPNLWIPLAAAAAVAILIGVMMHRPDNVAGDPAAESNEVTSAEGFAVLGNLMGAKWTGGRERRKGETLGAEILHLDKGVAEVQFFSGAMMVVKGPAEIVLKSAWEATCREGVVRMQVPPAARGFKLHAPSTEIIDLGTEFGLEVRDGAAHVEVLDGEILVRHRNGEESLMKSGAAMALPEKGEPAEQPLGRVAFPDLEGMDDTRLRQDFERWQIHQQAFARDPRVIAYYTFDGDNTQTVIPNLTVPRNTELDGAVILAEPAAGRWGDWKQALEFRRPGSRVRVSIPGEFDALTFAAWVRIDSLDRRYNALFMGDGYETGEPHWQIRNDGKLMLSVMVDDSEPHPEHPDVRYHHVYYSPSMWNLSMSGQWVHVASVYDPLNRTVSHYVNGERISQEAIDPAFLVKTLRIGNGEIGNWGQPFRETPWFSIRNLNGRIDELAILNAAVDDNEIRELHRRSQAAHH